MLLNVKYKHILCCIIIILIVFTSIFVINKNNKNWGLGQIQSSINDIITVNFENVGKKVINTNEIKLEIIKPNVSNRSA